MFCPKCGKGEQTPDSYCRSCGEFLTDFSAKSYLIKRLLGGAGPKAQIKFNLVINVVTGFASAFLLGFLNGHYDALYAKTGEVPPSVINYVYVFLGLVFVWQLLGFLVNTRLLKRLYGKKKKALPAAAPADDAKAVAPPPPQKSLAPGHIDPVAPDSVTQHTTKILDKLPRK
jgi:hypothetical protein